MSSYQDIWFSIPTIRDRMPFFRVFHGIGEGISCPNNGMYVTIFRKKDFFLPRDIQVKYPTLSRNNVQ
jgi:hypothetical protein